MSITSITTDVTGQISVNPRRVKIVCTDSFATITAANYLQSAQKEGFEFLPTDFFDIAYGPQSNILGTFTCTITVNPSVITLLQYVGQGNVTFATSTSSATPGTIRSLVGKISETASTMTSGNIVGVRGEADLVGASGGFVYGTQGKIIPTGTLSGSVWAAAVFGQFDIHGATVNGAQLAALWGDWGATGATATDLSGCRGVAFTNTTSNVLNAQDYRYGNATYLQELAGAGGTLNYYKAAGTSSGSAGDSSNCNAQKVLEILINGTPAYIPVFTQNT